MSRIPGPNNFMYVYVITTTVNDKVYVGQHCGNDLDAYLRHNIRHALNNSGDKPHLYNAIRKYGPESFKIRPLCYCNDKEQMDVLEKVWIAECSSNNPDFGYNITAGGGGVLGVSNPHTEETKLKMSLSRKGKPKTAEWSKKIGDSQRGRPFTEEHKAALRMGQIGKKKSRSPEHCEKIRQNKLLWWAKKKENNVVSA
jgi:group I intron endonuclease